MFGQGSIECEAALGQLKIYKPISVMHSQPQMEILVLPGWKIEYDRDATAAAYNGAVQRGPAACACGSCRNWCASRERLLSKDFRNLLDELGIPYDHEIEVYHNGRLENGLHSYGGWYHFIGRVLFGEHECSPNVDYGGLSVYFHSKQSLLADSFIGQPVVQLEIEAMVPWLSDVPEEV